MTKIRPAGTSGFGFWDTLSKMSGLFLYLTKSPSLKAAEQACEKAAASGCEDYIGAVWNEEGQNIEEAIGVTFVILQTKIRRVVEAAAGSFPKQCPTDILGTHDDKPHSLIKLIWELANYYKAQRRMVSIRLAFATGKGVNTRKVVETVGVKMATANLRTALKNLGISRYSECKQLATHVQRWAEQIFGSGKNASS
jgi:hypothetical protein